MKTIVLTTLLVLAVSASVFLLEVTFARGEEYKSMCELHPEKCAESNIAKLGQTVVTESGNHIFKVLAEAKVDNKPKPTWYQFIDTCRTGEKLDGKCDFVIYFELRKDGLYVRKFSTEQGISILKHESKISGIKYEDYIHKAGRK